jgi:hypothetical protein
VCKATCHTDNALLGTNIELARGCALTELAPLELIFDASLEEVVKKFEQFLEDNSECWLSEPLKNNASTAKLHHGCLGFGVEWREGPVTFSGFRTVFTHASVRGEQTIISVRLSADLAGGNRSPPIVCGLLALGVKLVSDLKCDFVKWNPGRLISDPAFFVENVDSYLQNGAFPVLVTVDFELTDDGKQLETKGLNWFAGQEIAVTGCGLRDHDLVRRAVRLVHDIATQGPVFQRQKVPDLDTDKAIDLVPDANGGTLHCAISSILDHVARSPH